MAKEVVVTHEGYKKLEADLEVLRTVRRKEVADKIKTARGYGDLSENAEYDAARKAQAEMEGEIEEIEEKLRNAKIIHETTVTCAEVIDGVEQSPKTYTIVGTSEADLKSGRISDESPVGSALIKAQDGQTVQVSLPNGKIKTIKVLKITR